MRRTLLLSVAFVGVFAVLWVLLREQNRDFANPMEEPGDVLSRPESPDFLTKNGMTRNPLEEEAGKVEEGSEAPDTVPSSALGQGIWVVDPSGAGLEGVGLYYDSAVSSLRSDAQGWLPEPPGLPTGAQVLIVDSQRTPRVIPWPASPRKFVLEELRLLPLQVQWAHTLQPLAQGIVQRRFALEGSLRNDQPIPSWIAERLQAVYASSFTLDSNGETNIILPDFDGVYGVLEIRSSNQESHGFLVPLRMYASFQESRQEYEKLILKIEAWGRQLIRMEDSLGRPLHGRPVTVNFYGSVLETQSDEGGLVHVPTMEWNPYLCDIQIRLTANQWWGANRFSAKQGDISIVSVDYQTVSGHIIHPTPELYEIATAYSMDRVQNRSAPLFRARPWPWSQLEWTAIASDARFSVQTGWQGTPLVLLVRDRSTRLIVARHIVQERGFQEIHLPSAHKIKFQLEPGSAQIPNLEFEWVETRDGREISPQYRGVPLRFKQEELPLTHSLANGVYQSYWVTARTRMKGPRYEVTEATQVIELEVPPLRRISGRTLGRIRGPVSGVELNFIDPDGRILTTQKSGFDGEYNVELLHEGMVEIEAYWPPFDGQWWLDEEAAATITANAKGDIRAEILLDEARLWVEKDKEDPLFVRNRTGFYLYKWNVQEEEQDWGRLIEALDTQNVVELTVLPGHYRVGIGFHGSEAFTETIHLESGQSGRLQPRSKGLGRFELEFSGPSNATLLIELRCIDTGGQTRFEVGPFWTETDSEGSVDFQVTPFLSPGQYELVAKITARLEGGQEIQAQPRGSFRLGAGKIVGRRLTFSPDGSFAFVDP